MKTQFNTFAVHHNTFQNFYRSTTHHILNVRHANITLWHKYRNQYITTLAVFCPSAFTFLLINHKSPYNRIHVQQQTQFSILPYHLLLVYHLQHVFTFINFHKAQYNNIIIQTNFISPFQRYTIRYNILLCTRTLYIPFTALYITALISRLYSAFFTFSTTRWNIKLILIQF